MSRYHHNKVTHELEPIAGYGSRVATSVDGKTLTVHSSILNIDGYNYGQGDIGAAVQMIATIETGMVATKDYMGGECFVHNAILYVVTEDVDDGDEFVIGENCELAPNLSEQILATRGMSALISNQLVVDNTKFYFDSHDGKYGYNTSAARGADTFHPFKNSELIVFSNHNGSVGTIDNTYTCTTSGIFYYSFGGYVSDYAKIWLNGVAKSASWSGKYESYNFETQFTFSVNAGDTIRRYINCGGNSGHCELGVVLS